MSEETKKCQFCGEEILAVAIKCRHCQSLLDGSEEGQKINVTGIDPMADGFYERSTDGRIRGKSKGKLTFIGKIGIVLGFLIILVSFISMGTATYDVELENLFIFALIGVGFIVASFLWARKPVNKKKK